MAKDPGPGHNSGVAGPRLNAFVQRIEKLNEEKKAISEDTREVFAEAKSAGFDTKVMRAVIKRRAMDKADLEELDALIETYEGVLS